MFDMRSNGRYVRDFLSLSPYNKIYFTHTIVFAEQIDDVNLLLLRIGATASFL